MRTLNICIGICIAGLLSAFIAGCDQEEPNKDLIMGITKFSNPYSYKKVCIDRVVYIQGIKKISVWINPKTLTPSNCKIENGKLIIEG